jgi:hypothetical protein
MASIFDLEPGDLIFYSGERKLHNQSRQSGAFYAIQVHPALSETRSTLVACSVYGWVLLRFTVMSLLVCWAHHGHPCCEPGVGSYHNPAAPPFIHPFTGTYYNPAAKPYAFNMTHVEIFIGGDTGEATIGEQPLSLLRAGRAVAILAPGCCSLSSV